MRGKEREREREQFGGTGGVGERGNNSVMSVVDPPFESVPCRTPNAALAMSGRGLVT